MNFATHFFFHLMQDEFLLGYSSIEKPFSKNIDKNITQSKQNILGLKNNKKNKSTKETCENSNTLIGKLLRSCVDGFSFFIYFFNLASCFLFFMPLHFRIHQLLHSQDTHILSTDTCNFIHS